MTWLSANAMWEQFATRTLFHAVYGGADIGEVRTTVDRIGDAGDWCREWSATAARLSEQAASNEARGHQVSAHDAYLRAAMYLRTAYQPLYGAPVDPRLAAAFDAEQEALAGAVRCSDGDLELVEIPFEGATLPGLLARATGGGDPRATIIHVNGYDSDLTEMLVAHVPAAVRRGYDMVLVDGPGQGRNLIRDGLHLRPDWETVVTPVIDWLVEQPRVDPARIVLAGWSLGGYLAPRAAAFEPRVRALIADPGQWDQRDAFIGRLPLTDEQKATFPDGVDPSALDPMAAALEAPGADPMLRWSLVQRGPWVNGVGSLYELFADLCRYRISDVAHQIACPTLLAHAEEDPVGAGAPKLAAAIGDHATLMAFTTAEGAGGHCEGTARRLFHERSYNWLDETLT